MSEQQAEKMSRARKDVFLVPCVFCGHRLEEHDPHRYGGTEPGVMQAMGCDGCPDSWCRMPFIPRSEWGAA